MIKILLGIIVLAFIFMGVGSFREDKIQKIASVNEDPISYEEYQKVYRNILDGLHNQYGNRLDDKMIKMFNLKQRAIDNLIQEKLLMQQAERLGILVTDEEVSESIANMKAFQTDGNFDVDRYAFLLKRVRLDPAEFETDQKKMLLSEKLTELIAGNVKVSESEALEWYNWQNALVSLDIVQFPSEGYTDITTDDDELKEYYDKNQSRYQAKPEVKVRYVSFPAEKYESAVDVSDEEISLYYQDNTKDFFNPKTVEAGHILIKVDPSADDDTVAKKKQQILDILAKVKKGEQTFAELAKTYSEGPSGKKGGHLGTFKKEAMVKPFADKAFSMKAGEVSEPVRTDFGWHIIKVYKVNDAYTSSLDEAKNTIRDTLLSQKSKTAAYDEAMSVFEVSFEGDDLIRVAKTKGLEVLTTDFFTRIGPKEIKIGRSVFTKAAFEIEEDQVSDVLEVKNGFYILQVVEKKPAGALPFEEALASVRKDLIKDKKKDKAEADAEAFLTELKNGGDMKKESERRKLTMITTDFFKRRDPIPDVGREPQINDIAFKLSKQKRLPGAAINTTKGYCVIKLRERKKPEKEDFEKGKSALLEQLLMQKKNNLFEKWVAGLKEKSDITIEKEFL